MPLFDWFSRKSAAGASATVNGIALAYRDEGQGEPIVLVHAFPLSGAMWEDQIDALATRFRVVAPDLRGFGASARGSGMASLDQAADDVAALLDHLQIERATLVGLSMGGYIAFAMLRRHRARIARLVLADTRAGADSEEGRLGREQSAQLAEQNGAGAIAEQMLPRLLSAGASAAVRDEVRKIVVANDRAGIAAAQRAMAARPDSNSLLATIDIPTLLIVGAADVLTPPDEARAMQRAIAHSTLVEIAGAGHLANIEAPDEFSAAIEAFIAGPQALGRAGGGLAGQW
ncbi:alpha/beta fold hydrolase [Kouleothrix sp.]|uniref:alpha/beta fold hydrolase n=1 Tax=Kouleothrix sp. TaxID=2779161 RepID=UPI00391CC424